MTLKVAPLGLGERSVKAIMLLFRKRYRGRVTVCAARDAQVILFNMDRQDAREDWARVREQYPEQGAVLIGREDPGIDDALFVRLPIQPDEFELVLKQAAGQLVTPQRHAPLGVPVPSGAAREQLAIAGNVHFSEDDYLLGDLKRTVAANPGKALAILLTGGDALLIRPDGRRVETSLTPAGIARLAGMPNSAKRPLITDTRVGGTGDALGELPEMPFSRTPEALLWEFAVHTSKGRVPEGVLLDEPLYLRHWPNLTRLYPIPGAVRIAALWVQEPRSLISILGAVKVPFAHVVTFYSAAHAIGLAGVGKREVDNLIAPVEVEMSEQNDLIGSILQKIGAEFRSATARIGG